MQDTYTKLDKHWESHKTESEFISLTKNKCYQMYRDNLRSTKHYDIECAFDNNGECFVPYDFKGDVKYGVIQ